MKGRRRGEGNEKTKGDAPALQALRTTLLSRPWLQLLQPLGFTRRTKTWDAPKADQQIARAPDFEYDNTHSFLSLFLSGISDV